MDRKEAEKFLADHVIVVPVGDTPTRQEAKTKTFRHKYGVGGTEPPGTVPLRKKLTNKEHMALPGMVLDGDLSKIEARVLAHMASGPRSLYVIAAEIRKLWRPVNYAAVPYLDAMLNLNSINDKYYADDARSVVAYFLSNARTWKGEDAKRIKAELNSLLKGKA